MFDKMKELMEMKKQAEQIKRELDAVTVEVTDVRGIKITINGSQDFKSISIDQNILNPTDKTKFENDLLRSLNIAVRKSQNEAAKKMRSMPGLNLPGM